MTMLAFVQLGTIELQTKPVLLRGAVSRLLSTLLILFPSNLAIKQSKLLTFNF